MNRFLGKKILISPKTATSSALKNVFINQGVDVVGFCDKNKKECFKIEDIPDADFIVIMSPNHGNEIYEECIKVIDKNRLYFASLKDGKYRFLDKPEQKRDFFYSPCEINVKREKLVFISKDNITSNNKALYLYCIKNNIKTIMLTDNNEQLNGLSKLNLPAKKLDSKEGDFEIACAKYIIFDQGDFTYLPKLHETQKTVQLWHGVGLKKMAKNTNIEYDYFISTSHWTNDTNFKNIFLAKEFLNCGYPRNDVFFKDEAELDLLFCDGFIYDIVKKTDKKVVVFMPTHKESGFELGFDLGEMDTFLGKNNTMMILKLHPFVLKFYNQNKTKKEYKNIFFHNANGDIYPILKYTHLLISDYSSIVYDYILLDKPIVFFIHDKDIYNQNMQFLFDYDKFSPGDKAKTQKELENAIIKNLQHDGFQAERQKVKEMFFDFYDGDSCKRILIQR